MKLAVSEAVKVVIAVPEEIKNNGNRVVITPAGVQALVDKGYAVVIKTSTV